MRQPAVYIITNRYRGTLYTGVTANLVNRIFSHRNELINGFSKKYHCRCLVYFETGEEMYSAIQREKQIKNLSRKNKIQLIESKNPQWKDLWLNICT